MSQPSASDYREAIFNPLMIMKPKLERLPCAAVCGGTINTGPAGSTAKCETCGCVQTITDWHVKDILNKILDEDDMGLIAADPYNALSDDEKSIVDTFAPAIAKTVK